MKRSKEIEYFSKEDDDDDVDDITTNDNDKIEDAVKNSTNLLVSQIIGIVTIPSKDEIKKQYHRLSFKLQPTSLFQGSHQVNIEMTKKNENENEGNFENNQQELYHDGNENDLTSSTETVAEFSRRKSSLTQDAAATFLPPKVLLENTKDEKLLMRFVSIIVHCEDDDDEKKKVTETHFNESISHFAGHQRY
jgi:hypothetical protein